MKSHITLILKAGVYGNHNPKNGKERVAADQIILTQIHGEFTTYAWNRKREVGLYDCSRGTL